MIGRRKRANRTLFALVPAMVITLPGLCPTSAVVAASGTTLSACTTSAFIEAINKGGTVTVKCSGTISLSKTIAISTG